MDTMNPFTVYDVVMATDASIQAAHANGFKTPPTGEITVLAINEDQVLLADGSMWHFSHFRKVGESILKAEAMEAAEEMEAVYEEDPLDNFETGCQFNEAGNIIELAEYVAGTYRQHYAKDGVQAFSLIAKRPQRGLDFAISNGIKYLDRYGEKAGRNRKDLLKAAHYIILAMYCHDVLESDHE